MRRAVKKIVLFSIFVILLNAFNPYVAKAKILYHENSPHFIETSPEQYLLIYNKIGEDSGRDVSSEIYARPCYLTVTEFKTHDTEEVLITPTKFVINKTLFKVQKIDAFYYNGRTMLVFAIERNDTDFTYFFLQYSDDDGKTWSNYVVLGNSTAFSKDFVWFDSAVLNDELVLFFSYEVKVIVQTRIFTKMVRYNLQTFENSTDVTSLSISLGSDFNLYAYNNLLYVAYTENNLVKITTTVDGSSFSSGISVGAPFQLDLTDANLTEVVAHDVGYLYPSITRWNNGFYVVAQDISNTTINKANRYEMFLWGFWIEDLSKQETLEFHNVSSPNHDGYYERAPSVTTFRDNVVVAAEQGPSVESNKQTREIAFYFSKDGFKWTNAYFGIYTFLKNPAVYYFMGTLALFVIVFTVNLIMSKVRKRVN
ncbi:MAG: hypothetical protein ACTSXD_05335 [Candidatus Heimdallarchaeaceae archaeon]